MLRGFLAVGIGRNRWLRQCSDLRLPHYCGNEGLIDTLSCN